MDEPGLREADKLAKQLAGRQYADWRELRFEPLTSGEVRRRLAELAKRMRDAIQSDGSMRPPEPGAGGVHPESEDRARGVVQRQDKSQPVTKNEPTTHVVDQFGQGDYPSIGTAIRGAQPGDRILVRAGTYEEALVLDKPLEIIGRDCSAGSRRGDLIS